MGNSFVSTIACGVICEQDHKILMVREHKEGKIVWNQPVGHLEPQENLFDAAIRETYEETGLTVELTGFIGAYLWQVSKSRSALRFCFVATVVGGELGPKFTDEIISAHWLTREELIQAEAEFRNPLTKICLEDYFSGKIFPLEAINSVGDLKYVGI
jgi:8-oxo-dGTP pyrophosphatase MutT (NUDIX family)